MRISKLVLVFFGLIGFSTTAQTVFYEPFDELSGSVTGVDNSGSNIGWTASCPTCIPPGDWFQVTSGQMEGTDTNGPGTWTSDTIDISSCSTVQVSFDISESGTLEDCSGSCGCNCVDWVLFEYNVDGTGWTTPTGAISCTNACAGSNYIVIGDLNGVYNYVSPCIPGTSTLQIRISVQTWAANESFQFDNITVQCGGGDPGLDDSLTYCGLTSSVDLFSILGGTPDNGGTWSGTSALTNGDLGTFNPSVNTVGVYTYTVGSAGCSSSADITVIPGSPPSPGTSDSLSICPDDTVISLFSLLGGSPATGGTWLGPSPLTGGDSGIFDPATSAAGHYTYHTGSGSCSDSSYVFVTILPAQDASITPAGPFCFNQAPVNLTANGTGVWSGAGITDAFAGTFDPSISGSGIFQIIHTISGQCGAADTTNITVTAPLVATLIPAGTICSGASVTLIGSATGGIPPYNLIWLDGTMAPAGSGTSVTVSPTSSESFTLVVTDGCSEPDSSSTTITVLPSPQALFSADTLQGCLPLTVNFTDVSTGSTSCEWDFGDGGSEIICGNVSHTFTSEGCFDISLKISNGACADTLSFPDLVCAYENPTANFSFPDNVTVDYTEVSFTNKSNAATNYQWLFDNSSTSAAVNPVYLFPAISGTYPVCLTAFNSIGCSSTVCDSITIGDSFSLYIPNAFSPNDDGINDLFYPVLSTDDLRAFHFYIFDRWGHLVFESNNPMNAWTGMDQTGNPLKQGVYVWKITYGLTSDHTNRVQTGHITLIR